MCVIGMGIGRGVQSVRRGGVGEESIMTHIASEVLKKIEMS
jgi:hypothetical protein